MMILWLNGWTRSAPGCTCGERISHPNSNKLEVIGLVVNHDCPVHSINLRRYSLNPERCNCLVTVEAEYGFASPVYQGSNKCEEHKLNTAYSKTRGCTCGWDEQDHGSGYIEPFIAERDPFCFQHSHYPYDRAVMK